MGAAHATTTKTLDADFRLGPWRVSPQLNQISRNGNRIGVQDLSMRVLVYLAGRQGRVVSKDELVENLWSGRVVGDEAVHRRIADLRRQLGDDSRSPAFIQTIPKKGYRLVATVSGVAGDSASRRFRPSAVIALGVAIVVAVVATMSALSVDTANDVSVDTEAPAMTRVTIETSPPGAMVYYRHYARDGEWKTVGMSPIETELPVDTLQLRFVADGSRLVEMAAPNPSTLFNNVDRDYYVVELPPATDAPADMAYVPAVETIVPLFGYFNQEDLGRFYIGRTEVSNREFAEFVADGGYQAPVYWESIDEPAFEFSMVAERFIDTTGQPGPASWVDGRFPPGSSELPVTGVSWYEAMAYARYRGMTLPTARHWARAALGIDENRWPLAPAVLEFANIEGTSPKPVSDGQAMSTWGAINLLGNVREWTTTAEGEARISAGLGFASPQWQYAMPSTSHPLQRLPDQGFRLASYIDDVPDPPMTVQARLPVVPQVTDDEFSKYMKMFGHDRDPKIADVATVDYVRPDHDWIRERVVITTDALPEPLPVLIFRPAGNNAGLQPIIYLPPGDSYSGKLPSEGIDITRYDIEFVVESGRALVWPIIAGTHDRFSPRPDLRGEAFIKRWIRGLKIRRSEIGTLLDYLETRPDFDAERTGLLAASFGATFVSPSIIAAESRIDTVVLMSSSLAPVDSSVFPNVVNPNTYWPRIKTPILLLNGSYDIATHVNQSRDLLLTSLGAAEDDKHGVIYDASHWPLPPHRVRDDALAWFDRYLGPVAR
jgi:DNA-binding winged helix-turn-helix (wHTH) protein